MSEREKKNGFFRKIKFRKLELPEEVVGGLEVWSTGGNFVDEVLNTGDSDLSQLLLDNSVVAEWDSSSLNSDESSLVDEFLDGGDRGISREKIKVGLGLE